VADQHAREGFDKDLRFGEAREDAFVNMLLQAKVEHKSDQICRRTGNVFVEYSQRGRPSGIAVTTADWWSFEVNENIWLFVPVEHVKDVARDALRKGRGAVGGDFNRYAGVLVPVMWLIMREVRQTARLTPTVEPDRDLWMWNADGETR
jgi:hypothetical protein